VKPPRQPAKRGAGKPHGPREADPAELPINPQEAGTKRRRRITRKGEPGSADAEGERPDAPADAGIPDRSERLEPSAAIITEVLEDLRRLASDHVCRRAAEQEMAADQVDGNVLERIERSDELLRFLLAQVARSPTSQSIMEQRKRARANRAALSKLIKSVEDFQGKIEPSDLALWDGNPERGRMGFGIALTFVLNVAAFEWRQISNLISPGRQPKIAFDAAMASLCECWYFATGAFPVRSRAKYEEVDTGPFAEWAVSTLKVLAPDLHRDLQTTGDPIAQSVRRFHGKRKRDADAPRGLGAIFA
jgi:hypothetical protein